MATTSRNSKRSQEAALNFATGYQQAMRDIAAILKAANDERPDQTVYDISRWVVNNSQPVELHRLP